MRTPDHEDDRTGRGHTTAFGVEPKTPAVCPDAAELAAWIEGASATGGRAKWDGHIAQCARCQQVVAAFATADPPDAAVKPHPARVGQRERFWLFRWSWALSAAAVVVVAAFGWLVVRPVVYETTSTPPVATSLDLAMGPTAEPAGEAGTRQSEGRARMEAAGGAPSPNTQAGIREGAAGASGETSAAGGSAAREPLTEGAAAGVPAGTHGGAAGARAAQPAEAPTATRARTDAPTGALGTAAAPPAEAAKTAGGATTAAGAAPPGAPPGPAGIAGARRPTEPVGAPPGRVAQPGAASLATAPPAAAPPSAERERAQPARAAAAEKPAQVLAEDRAAAPRPAVQRVGLAEDAATARGAGGEVVVVAAGSPAVRWRARPGGVFETSEDEGRTWVLLDLADSRQVLAGSAPSRSVCWFVGRRGLVVRVGPGVSPDMAPFPEVVDLIDVEATSALAAMVTTADGRAFFTSDGGATWRR